MLDEVADGLGGADDGLALAFDGLAPAAEALGVAIDWLGLAIEALLEAVGLLGAVVEVLVGAIKTPDGTADWLGEAALLLDEDDGPTSEVAVVTGLRR